LKEEDPVDIRTHAPNEVSKLDPPAVKRPPARCVAFGAADLMSNNGTDGVDQEDQDGTEEDITRRDDRDKGDGITEEVNDGLQHDDELNGQEKNDSHVEVPRQKRTKKSFEERIEKLTSFKAKHEHVHVTAKHDKSLGSFCREMRCARRARGNGRRKVMTEDRIKALDELGFDWGDKKKSFEERIEELKAFKAKHGHVHVTLKHGKSLYGFCNHVRCAHRGKGTSMTITEDRIKALDELGFDWEVKNSPFEKRIEELEAFKEKHGHVRVTVKQGTHEICSSRERNRICYHRR